MTIGSRSDSSIRIPKTFSEIVFPALRQGRDFRGATEELLVVSVRRIEVHNLGDGDAGFLFLDKVDRIARADFSFAQHRQVKSGPFALQETFDDIGTIESDPKLVARHSRLRDYELG